MRLNHSRRWRRPVMAGVLAVMAVCVTSATSAPAGGAPAPRRDGTAEAMMMPEFPGMVAAFRRDHPTIGAAAAAIRVGRQHIWIRLVDELSAGYPDAFGGSWYDGATDTLHLQVADVAAEARFASAAKAVNVRAALHRARFSLLTLEAEYKLLVNGRHPRVGAAAAGHAGIDVRANRAVAAVPLTSLRALQASMEDGRVQLVGREAPVGIVPQACVDRWHCGVPLRSGVALWRDPGSWASDPDHGYCSLGFTATATEAGQASTRWVLTAGHCGAVNPADCLTACWRHGEQPIGPMRQTACAQGCGHTRTNVDVGRIRVNSSYWLGGSRGWMFNSPNPDSPTAITQRASTLAQIPIGATACIQAQWSHPSNGSFNCGTVASTADPDLRGLARVRGISACTADSGGGWYLPINGERRAVGIHFGSGRPDPDPNPTGANCRLSGSTRFSAFSTLKAINDFFDETTTATIRVDIRN